MDSSNNKNSSKNKKDNLYRKEFSQLTHQTFQPTTTGSSWDTDSGDDPFILRRNVAIDFYGRRKSKPRNIIYNWI